MSWLSGKVGSLLASRRTARALAFLSFGATSDSVSVVATMLNARKDLSKSRAQVEKHLPLRGSDGRQGADGGGEPFLLLINLGFPPAVQVLAFGVDMPFMTGVLAHLRAPLPLRC